MKREAKRLLDKAVASLTLAVEVFNRPSDLGRHDTVLILLDHANEMLLKAAIVHRKGRIRDGRAKNTHGFDKCVRIGVSGGPVRFLSEEQALTLQAVNGMRDAAQHHLIELSESQLYMYAQANVTMVRDLLRTVFSLELSTMLPARVLPISTIAPVGLDALFISELEEVARLLAPGKRKKTEARARLKPLVILDATLKGQKHQPTDAELDRIGTAVSTGRAWSDVFPNVAALDLAVDQDGPAISLRFTKKEGIPVHIVPEGTEGATVVALKTVNPLSFYNLNRDQVAQKIGLTPPKTTALIRHLGIRGDANCCREIVIGKLRMHRYSFRAVERMREALKTIDMDVVWSQNRLRSIRAKTAKGSSTH